MKRRTLILTSLMIFTLALAGCQTQPKAAGDTTQVQQQDAENNSQNNNQADSQMQAKSPAGTQTQTAAEGEITESKAKEIALSDAGVAESDILNIRIEKDYDDGKSVYDIDFYIQNKEYDYEIDAVSGEILSRDYDIENDFLDQPQAGTGTSVISQDEAVNIVLSRVSGATAQNVYMNLETDDGYQKYEGQVRYNGMEYEFELNAENGNVLEWSEEREDD